MSASRIAELVSIGDQSAATWSKKPELGGAPGFEGITCTYSCSRSHDSTAQLTSDYCSWTSFLSRRTGERGARPLFRYFRPVLAEVFPGLCGVAFMFWHRLHLSNESGR